MLRNLACEGMVLHRRAEPLAHAFRYPVWMLWLDVDTLQEIEGPLFSRRRRLAPLSVLPGDYPRDGAGEGSGGRAPDIRGAVNARLASEGAPPADQVFLLTQPRSWGWLFNPVSFYFCYRAGGLTHVIAEITNTPWNEVHSYVLTASSAGGETESGGTDGGAWEFVFPKRFHVSPFMPMDLEYRWRVKLEEDSIEIAMHLSREGREVFFAGLYLQPRPLTRSALRRGALRYPLQNLRTLARIYYQALYLRIRRAPFYAHPQRREEVGTP